MKATYYEILDVKNTATPDNIKAAFRDKSLKHHPDVNNNSVESTIRFRIIYNAYSVLSDEDARRSYDLYLKRSSVFGGKNFPYEQNVNRRGKKRLSSTSDSLTLVFGHLNYLLWEIEDILFRSPGIASGIKTAVTEGEIVEILTRIDEQVLRPAGFPDYFYVARNMNPPINSPLFQRDGNHQPFVNVEDYFYNIRNRANEFISRTNMSDVQSVRSNDGIAIVDRILGIYNDATRYFGRIRGYRT